MASNQATNPTPQTLVVVGAGPKAAAICAKAQVLAELGYPPIRVVVIEQEMVANNWRGKGGFTDGKCFLGTPPEKDVGFPYNSQYGIKVDKAMLAYSWQAFKMEWKRTAYGDWVDRGRPHPEHQEWASYIDWVFRSAPPDDLMRGEVVQVVPAGGKLEIKIRDRKRIEIADGIVFTGPGPAKLMANLPSNTQDIFDGRSYWHNLGSFKDTTEATIALIGGGETAASIALSLLDLMAADRGPVFNIHIINRNGAIFTRGESFRENRMFTHPPDWQKLDQVNRQEFIKRTDRGVFSVAAQMRLNQAERVTVMSGRVIGITRIATRFGKIKLAVDMARGKPPAPYRKLYDKVIIARGFNAFHALELLPTNVRPVYQTDEEKLALELNIDEHLRIPFASAPEPPSEEPNVHMPMIAGLAQGPGYPNLSCLGHLADAILSNYITPPKP